MNTMNLTFPNTVNKLWTQKVICHCQHSCTWAVCQTMHSYSTISDNSFPQILISSKINLKKTAIKHNVFSFYAIANYRTAPVYWIKKRLTCRSKWSIFWETRLPSSFSRASTDYCGSIPVYINRLGSTVSMLPFPRLYNGMIKEVIADAGLDAICTAARGIINKVK